MFVSPRIIFGDYRYGEVSPGKVNEALANTTQVRFLPPNPVYYLSRVKELFSRFFTASSVDRAKFDFMISSKRLHEAYILFGQGKYSLAKNSLEDYDLATKRSVGQLKKARSQNQDVTAAVDEMVEKLNYQEILLIYLAGANRDEPKLQGAFASFESYVNELNSIKPGILTRFKILRVKMDSEGSSSAKTNSAQTAPIEPTASAVPRRVIF